MSGSDPRGGAYRRASLSSLRSSGPTGRAGNTAMASECQGRRNRLLAALTSEDHSLLAPHFKELPVELGSLLQEAGEPVEYVYFPHEGMISLLAVMSDGRFRKVRLSEIWALIYSRCSLWEKGEANLLKLLGVQTFSVASSMTLNSAAPPDWILTLSPPVRACRGHNLAPRVNQTLKCDDLNGDVSCRRILLELAQQSPTEHVGKKHVKRYGGGLVFPSKGGRQPLPHPVLRAHNSECPARPARASLWHVERHFQG